MKSIIPLILLLAIITSSFVLGKQFPAVNLKSLDGKSIAVSTEFAKNKLTVVSFWATWCSPCKKELDAINPLYQEWKKMGVEMMAITIDECQQIYQAVQKSGKRLMVGFNRRFAPYYAEMKELIKNRTSPIVVSTRMNSPGIEKGWAAEAGQGGVVLGEGCHFVDLMYWLTESEPVSVSAYGFDQHNVAATFKFADGSIGNFIYTVVGSESSGGEMVEVFSQGVAATTEDFKRLVVKKKDRKGRSKFFADKGYDEQLASFVKSLKDGKETEITAVDGTRATLGCLLMLESARTGKPCDFNLDEILK